MPEDDVDPSGPIDSDEEKDAVMAAVARSRPLPAAQHIFVPLRKKYAYVRMKEMLSNALGGRSGGNIFGVASMPQVEIGATVAEAERRASAGRGSIGGVPVRKASAGVVAGA